MSKLPQPHHRSLLDKLSGRNRLNNKDEAIALLELELEKRRKLPYGRLLSVIGHEPETFDLTAKSGIVYQFEFESLWEDKKTQTVRLLGSIDGGDISPTFPICRSFIKDSANNFIGDRRSNHD